MTRRSLAATNDRACVWFDRYRIHLAAALVVHQFVLYALFIGFPSWDGLTYRVPPIVELVQHGSLGLYKYSYWAFIAYVPFIELAHAPFLLFLKLPGVLVGFPLVVFPLCIWAVHSFVFELTANRKSAFFAAAAYSLFPLVGEGVFSGYVDFVVCALLCFFLFAVLRAVSPERRAFDLVRLTLATVAFSLCRGQAVYIAGAVLAFFAYDSFVARGGIRLRPMREGLVRVAGAFVVGALPAMGLQIFKIVKYGAPIYPYQFQLFGKAFGGGIPMKALFSYAGIPDDSAKSLALAFVDGWLWSSLWPPRGFYDSRHLGAGLIMWIALLVVVSCARTLPRRSLYLLGVLVLLSVLSRDFCHPRWACTLLVAVILVVGVGMAQLATSTSRIARLAFVPLSLVLFAHAFRPELELLMLKGEGIGPRLNAGVSPYFIHGRDAFEPWPDLHAKIFIVQEKGFILPIYGARFTNEVVATIPGEQIGKDCEKLLASGANDSNALVIDDLDLTKACARECVLHDENYCLAYRLAKRPTLSSSP